MQDDKLREMLQETSNQKLQALIERSEDAIRQNRASIEDYSLFVVAQQELIRRKNQSPGFAESVHAV